MSGREERDEEIVLVRKEHIDDLIGLNEALLERCAQLIQRNKELEERAVQLERSLPSISVGRPRRRGSRLQRYLGTVFSFSYRNLFRRRWRTTLTVLSLIAAITGFVCTVNISQSIGLDLTSGEAERALFAGIDVGYPYFCDIVIAAEHPWWYDLPIGEPFRGPNSLVSTDLLAEIKATPGIEWVQPYLGDVRVRFQGTSLGAEAVSAQWIAEHENGTVDRFSSDILVAGVDPSVESRRLGNRILFLQGRNLEGDGQEIVVGYNFARAHNLAVGDTLVIPAERHLCTHDSPGKFRQTRFRSVWQSFWGWYEDQWQERFQFSIEQEVRVKIVGVFWTTTPYDDYIVTTYRSLQGIFEFGDRTTCVLAKLSADADVGQTLGDLWSLPGVNVYMPLLRKRYMTGADRVGSAFSGVTPTRFVTTANLQNILVSEVAAGIFIASVVFTSVHERRFEIGLLKALGFGSTFILSTLLVEALIIGLFAGLAGFFASSLLSVLSTGLLLPTGQYLPLLSSILPKIELKLTLEWGAMATGLSAATSLISSFVPAYLAAALPPIEAMRRG